MSATNSSPKARLSSLQRNLRTAVRLWGSPQQFSQMFSKAIRVMVKEGPHRLVYYARRKVEKPYLRYDETDRPPSAEEDIQGYQRWIELREAQIRHSKLAYPDFPYQPLISILMPVYNTDPRWLLAAVRSVLDQTYPHWELVITDDGSTSPQTQRALQEIAGLHSRIRIFVHSRNAGISAASNTCLFHAQGEFIALLDHDDELDPYALASVVKLLNEHPEADIIYSDEDKIGTDGVRCSPFFKPDWSPTLLLSMNYINHLAVYRTSVVSGIGGFRSEFDGSQDYDLILRCSEVTSAIFHIADVLYHWRSVRGSTALALRAKPEALLKGQQAVEGHLQRLGVGARVAPAALPGRHRLLFRFDEYPSVRVIIPTKNHLELLEQSIRAVEEAEYQGAVRITIVDNGTTDRRARAFLEKSSHTVVRVPGPFNFSSLVNEGATTAKEDLILLLNNDIEMVDATWLQHLVNYIQIPQVGVVGAHLIYPDRSTQHAGIVIGLGGVAGHAFWKQPADDVGYFGLQKVAREVSAVTGACLLTYTSLFHEAGGFPEDLPHSYSDIAFCLAVQKRGWRVLYVPDAVLIHHESMTRNPRVEPWEVERFRQKCQPPTRDPFYSPHLSLVAENTYTLSIADGNSDKVPELE
jgi:GT2 family glycosyltransferase